MLLEFYIQMIFANIPALIIYLFFKDEIEKYKRLRHTYKAPAGECRAALERFFRYLFLVVIMPAIEYLPIQLVNIPIDSFDRSMKADNIHIADEVTRFNAIVAYTVVAVLLIWLIDRVLLNAYFKHKYAIGQEKTKAAAKEFSKVQG